MITFAKNALFSSTGLLDIQWLQRISRLPLLCPYHHLVSDEPVPYIDPLYSFKNTRQFEKDLDYLLRHFQPLSLPDLIHRLSSSPDAAPPSRSFLLCFDDGLRQTYDIALPILLQKGIPAALFVNPCFIDNKNIFHDIKKGWLLHRLSVDPPGRAALGEACRLLGCASSSADDLYHAISRIDYNTRSVLDPLAGLLETNWQLFARDYQPAMSLSQLKDWVGKGMAVGAHSMDHPLYSLISPAEQLTQTLDSMNWVSDTLHVPYRAFAFPHVDTGVDSVFFQQLFSAARPPDLVLGNSTGMREAQPRVLHRYIGENPARSAAAMAKAVLAYSAFRKLIGRPFVRRR
jgi:peptidoglycan/xylan/chitin deacetylase (PgdA/CDA1 family)